MEVSQIIQKRKVTIINTLAVSPLIYLANVIYFPPQDDIDFPAFPNVKTVIFGSQCITDTVAVCFT